MDMIIEICANSFESAKAAQDGGAYRIELCTDLSVGGLTPSRDSIQKVVGDLNIPVHVLIRPRGGNFVYLKEEIELMLDDIAFCKKVGCSGIVSGALTLENTIDEKVTRQLIAASEGMEFTFHRAFDVVKDPSEAIESIMQLGVTRLLSSGQQHKAIEGIEMLKQLKSLSEGKLQIMPGSGINSENALAFKEVGFEAIHFSATKKASVSKTDSGFFAKDVIGTSDQREIERIIKIVSG
jgi:copper homeostasis protein